MEYVAWIWEYAIPFVFVLSVLVFIHEYGHYWVAKKCGVQIDSFSIGFGPEIIGFDDKHGTRWKFSLIPLGGYVKMYGDADPASMPSEEVAAMSSDERGKSFFHKKIWQRSAIVFAGPAANFLFAILVYTVLFMTYGQSYTPATINRVIEDGPAAAAGIQAGDTVTAIDGQSITRLETLMRSIQLNAGSEVVITVERGGELIDIPVTPDVEIIDDGFGGQGQRGTIGVIGAMNPPIVQAPLPDTAAEEAGFQAGDVILSVNGNETPFATDVGEIVAANPGELLVFEVERDGAVLTIEAAPRTREVEQAEGELPLVLGFLGVRWEPLADTRRVYWNPFEAIWEGTKETISIGAATFRAIGQLIIGERSTKELGGPIKIGVISGEVAQADWLALVQFMVLLSINLGLINLLPVPVLDGGHLMFYAIEAVRGKPLSLRAQEYSFRVGLALVLCLMLFATWNDVVNLL